MKNSKAILQVPGTMKIISAEIPVPKEDEVLIKVEYVGICGSDVHGFESGPFIPPKDPNQEIGLGHECAGTVVAVGSRVRKFKPGDRVNIEPGVPCGHCRYCLEGKYNICPDVDFMATQPNYRGALTHYLCHPESFTYKLPDNMDTLEEALDLFKLPRKVGEFEDKTVTIGTGRFGPYVYHNSKYVSLPKTYDPLEVTLDEAIELILAKREAEAKKHIKKFDEDAEMEILNGRYGPYIAYKGSNYKIPKDVTTVFGSSLRPHRPIFPEGSAQNL